MGEKSKHLFGILGEKVVIKLTLAIALSEDGDANYEVGHINLE